MDKKCLVCDRMFFAQRADAKCCNAKCRKAYSRQAHEEPVVQAKQEPTNDDWFNSAETKTQAEIEAHYTLENFPPVKYYSVNGGGSGSYSPYPLTDPRARAYALR